MYLRNYLLMASLAWLGMPNYLTASYMHNPTPQTYLALGDSYTKGEAVAEGDNFPRQLVLKLQTHQIPISAPNIIAQTGWRSDELLEAIHQKKPSPHDLVSLLIGVNNFYQGHSAESFGPQFEKLLLEAIALSKNGKSGVIVLSIPDYGYTPFGKADQARISSGIDTYNEVCKSISLKHGVKYLYITDISRMGLADPELVTVDDLHLSALAYTKIAERMVKELLHM
ncbi:MAG TPA: SGNH/GDSL hydrolase family protein [Cytophagales bacterium]|nr:SGNH/GDSL hydrolase family protein [Cytophagales bacterium]